MRDWRSIVDVSRVSRNIKVLNVVILSPEQDLDQA